MAWFTDLYRSAVGKKAVMAATGIILFGFVLGHLLGNLKLYLGPEALNSYSRFLRTVGEPLVPANVLLWAIRLLLIAAAVLHLWAAWQLSRASRAARPDAYVAGTRIHTTYASRTMRWGGVIILLFVIYHLLHLTWGTLHPAFVPGDVYHNVVTGFQVWWVSLFYIAAQVALGFHLYHGLWSMFQSLGWNHPRFNLWRNGFAHAFAWLITVGNISFPVAVLSGLVRLQ
ncbi:MAG TPA: succinate dehydrogenase cytochrome b subunit [Thermoanaerobaculia bacterium]|nr:succinate dehydrogenase cytochrome b subunit [Thermoanaerobaculia bacterium]